MSEKKKKKELEDTSGSLGGSVISSDDEDEDEGEISSTKIIKDFKMTCPCCHKDFPSTSDYNAHTPCPAC